MQLMVFTVYDKATKAYLRPFFARTKGEAVRSFVEACNDDKSDFRKYSTDFVLFYLGGWDDANSMFGCGEPDRLISAAECVSDFTAPAPRPGNGADPATAPGSDLPF